MNFFQLLKACDYMKTITRTKYLDRIIELNGTPDIKIITGICRSGKSKLMQAYIEYLKSHFENINIIFIDFMDLEFEEIKEYHALHSYVEQHYAEGKTNYLFIDEVQMCPKFELAINSLYSKGKYDIYMTGSNAFLLSADLATLFTGRYIEIHVFPFSFQEYCKYYDNVTDKDMFDHSHELTPKEKEIWMLFDRVDVAELLARDAFAKGAYMLGAEDREIMLK